MKKLVIALTMLAVLMSFAGVVQAKTTHHKKHKKATVTWHKTVHHKKHHNKHVK